MATMAIWLAGGFQALLNVTELGTPGLTVSDAVPVAPLESLPVIV
jgi:hypothetical protein